MTFRPHSLQFLAFKVSVVGERRLVFGLIERFDQILYICIAILRENQATKTPIARPHQLMAAIWLLIVEHLIGSLRGGVSEIRVQLPILSVHEALGIAFHAIGLVASHQSLPSAH